MLRWISCNEYRFFFSRIILLVVAFFVCLCQIIIYGVLCVVVACAVNVELFSAVTILYNG